LPSPFRCRRQYTDTAIGNTKIQLKDFGLTWNPALETAGILAADGVTITLDAQLVNA